MTPGWGYDGLGVLLISPIAFVGKEKRSGVGERPTLRLRPWCAS